MQAIFATLTLSPDTPLLLPLGVVCSLLIALLVATYKVANRIRDLTEQLKDMQRDIRASWTFRDQERWALQLERENRTRKIPLFVPDVKRAPAEDADEETA